MRAPLEVPERDGPIIPATGQRAAIGTHLERLDCSLMRFAHPHALQARHLPPAQPAVTASTEHQLFIESPGQRRDHPRIPHQAAIPCPPGRAALPAVGIPHAELPTVAAAAPLGPPDANPTPGHACANT